VLSHQIYSVRETMTITVILCTYNRSESLKRALESVATQDFPPAISWEVLVVDNNSSDQTRAVVENFCIRFPGRFRYLFEPRPGKSNALNSGIREAKGVVLAFMDDDVVVDPLWLKSLTSPMLGGKWVGSGGRILPESPHELPTWLAIDEWWAGAPLAMFDLGPNAGQLTQPPFGTNMAFQRRMFEKYGGFCTELGPRPGSEIRSEDTEFGRRLIQGGERLWYEPSAIVFHPVAPNRVRKEYFLRWWFDKARADVRELGVPSEGRWCVAGMPLVLFRRLIVWTLRWIFTINSSRRFSCKIRAWGRVGEILECYRQSHTRLLSTSATPSV